MADSRYFKQQLTRFFFQPPSNHPTVTNENNTTTSPPTIQQRTEPIPILPTQRNVLAQTTSNPPITTFPRPPRVLLVRRRAHALTRGNGLTESLRAGLSQMGWDCSKRTAAARTDLFTIKQSERMALLIKSEPMSRPRGRGAGVHPRGWPWRRGRDDVGGG